MEALAPPHTHPSPPSTVAKEEWGRASAWAGIGLSSPLRRPPEPRPPCVRFIGNGHGARPRQVRPPGVAGVPGDCQAFGGHHSFSLEWPAVFHEGMEETTLRSVFPLAALGRGQRRGAGRAAPG